MRNTVNKTSLEQFIKSGNLLLEAGQKFLTCAESLLDAMEKTDSPASHSGKTSAGETSTTDKSKRTSISKNDVRKLLANLAKQGYREEVIALLKKHGAASISDLSEDIYPALFDEAKSIPDGSDSNTENKDTAD